MEMVGAGNWSSKLPFAHCAADIDVPASKRDKPTFQIFCHANMEVYGPCLHFNVTNRGLQN